MASQLWNDPFLSPPPAYTFLSKNTFGMKLKSTLEKGVQLITSQDLLHNEAAILSRYIWKLTMKYRHSIGFSYLRRTNAALRKYLVVNLQHDIENFLDIIPDLCTVDVYLPTRQMLEYILVRLQSVTKIMVRVIFCSKKAAILFGDTMNRGHASWMGVLPYAILARIWSHCNILLNDLCVFYSQLYPYLHMLESVGVNFLPDSYVLPKCLKTWLEVDKLDEMGKVEWKKSNMELIKMADTGEDYDIFGVINYVSDVDPKAEHMQDPSPLTVILENAITDNGKPFDLNEEPAHPTSKINIDKSISETELDIAPNKNEAMVLPEKICRKKYNAELSKINRGQLNAGNNKNHVLSEGNKHKQYNAENCHPKMVESISREELNEAQNKKQDSLRQNHHKNYNPEFSKHKTKQSISKEKLSGALNKSQDLPQKIDWKNVNTNILVRGKSNKIHNESLKFNKIETNQLSREKMKKNKTTNSIETVTDSKTFTNFIAKEEKLRNANMKKSATKHLSNKQWSAVKTQIEDLIKSNHSPEKMFKSFKRIWKKMCLQNT